MPIYRIIRTHAEDKEADIGEGVFALLMGVTRPLGFASKKAALAYARAEMHKRNERMNRYWICEEITEDGP